jgi:hypothetical protein
MRAKRRRLDRIVEALASDDKQQRRSRALLFDEATTATNEQCGGVTVAQEHLSGAVDCRSAAGTQKVQGAGG